MPHFITLVVILLCSSAIAYNLLTVIAGWKFAREPHPVLPIEQLPPVSILKPLKGCDPQMYETFRSHCLQQYGAYEIVFGVNDASDEAVPFVQQLQREFPQAQIRLIVCERVLGANRKVSNLVQMLAAAKHDIIVVNDSDIRVGSGYLQEVVSTLIVGSARNIGLITCLYRGIPTKNLWSRIESLGVGADFMPACLAARLVERGVHFGLGSTLAFPRAVAQAIGGLETLVDHLADDYEMSAAVIRAGYKAELAHTVVDTFITDYTLRSFVDHQLRWGRAVRVSRPASYVGFLPMFGFFWSLVLLAVTRGNAWAWLVFVAFCVVRVASIYLVSYRVVRDVNAWRNVWLLPLRDLIAPAVWFASLFGNKIVWRGDVFTLKKGKLERQVPST